MGTRLLSALAIAALCAACRPVRYDEQAAVAVGVNTEPTGAKVTVNGIDQGWRTPCYVSDASLRRGTLEVVIELEGFETVRQQVEYDGKKMASIALRLTPAGGATVILQNAVPGASAYLLRIPAETKDAALLVRLWSENDGVLQETLAKIGDEDARRAPMRVRDLARVGSPPVQALAAAKIERWGALADPRPVAQKGIVNLNGLCRFPGIAAGEPYHLFATRAGSPDFHRAEVKLEARQELTIDAGMAPVKPAPPPGPAQNAQGPRIQVRSPGGIVRVSSGGKPVAEAASKAGELVEVPVPAGPVHVDFVDARTGVVTHSVDLLPEGAAAPPPPAEGNRVGQVQLVHPVFGVFVRLDPGLQLLPGDEIVIAREGREVARTKVVRVAGADATYPDGAVEVIRAVSVRKGDEVLRPK
jgi:hypothetical protein